jgi:hypothetical protein
MDEEKTQGPVEKKGHAVALGGRVVAVLSIVFLVPVIRRMREQRELKRKPRRHFPLFGH